MDLLNQFSCIQAIAIICLVITASLFIFISCEEGNRRLLIITVILTLTILISSLIYFQDFRNNLETLLNAKQALQTKLF